jgi:flagellar hook-associated protein 3 FlgL
MRMTNTMLIGNFMHNLNGNLRRVGHLQNQIASGRKFANISDDPVSLIYAQSARNQLAQLSHFHRSAQTGRDWITSAENGARELQRTLQHTLEEIVNAATDTKTPSDRQNIAEMIGQLRQHYVDNLNSTFSHNFVFGGHNTPGEPTQGGRTVGPFRLNEDGELLFNEFNISRFDGLPINILLDPTPANIALVTPAPQWAVDGFAASPPGLYANEYEYFAAQVDLLHALRNDVFTLDVGPAISMPVTMSGIDMVLFGTRDENHVPIMRCVFSAMNEVYDLTRTGELASDGTTPVERLSYMLGPLQHAHDHLLTNIAELGGRYRRLELITARFEQDDVNYTRMKSDAEDVELGEAIMLWRMAEAVYQSSLAAGARIIQPTLMDFLR